MTQLTMHHAGRDQRDVWEPCASTRQRTLDEVLQLLSGMRENAAKRGLSEASVLIRVIALKIETELK